MRPTLAQHIQRQLILTLLMLPMLTMLLLSRSPRQARLPLRMFREPSRKWLRRRVAAGLPLPLTTSSVRPTLGYLLRSWWALLPVGSLGERGAAPPSTPHM